METRRADNSPKDSLPFPGTQGWRAVSWAPELPHDQDGRAGSRGSLASKLAQTISSALERLRAFVQGDVLRQSRSNAVASISEFSSRVVPTPAPVRLAAAVVRRRMENGERFVFVDARTIDESIESPMRIERSVRMTVPEVEVRLKALPRDRPIVVYCTAPDDAASSLVAIELVRRGLLDVHPMVGGLDAWRAADGPIERA
jgi:rhodanese-related sulfurtransferase